MKRVAIVSLLGGVIGMIWGFLWWTVLPFSNYSFHELKDEVEVADVLTRNAPETGTYYFPFVDPSTEDQARMERHRQGPLGHIFIRHKGAEPMAGSVFLFGFLHLVASSFLVALLLHMAAPSLASFGIRWGFAVLIGVFGAVYHDLVYPIWFYHPWNYWLIGAVDHVLTWTLIGAVAAKLITPETAKV
ncbi:MAG: hypothetical protein M5R36_04410 [Deltaproteobacteria bacterium]|nr:hypothetical protein [Deltaproteobacteria bacterium]